jgi:hypothetical protein
MDNSMASRPASKLKGDPYRAYEELPVEVRLALQESLVDWCPLRAREWHLHLLQQMRLQPAKAAAFLIQTIRSQVAGLETKLASNAQRLAELRGIGLADIARCTTENFLRLFRVDRAALRPVPAPTVN